MNPILLFVLGTLSGSVLVGIIYAIFWMVKTHRTVIGNTKGISRLEANSQNDYEMLSKRIHESNKNIDDIYYGITQDLSKRIGEVDLNIRDLHCRDIEHLKSYIDSRIDKQYEHINRIKVTLEEKETVNKN
jgi:repressor of nif and glnA expression